MLTFSDIALDFLQKLFSFDKAHPLLFTQFYFWAFFAIVFAVFSLIKNRCLLRNAFLFFVSLHADDNARQAHQFNHLFNYRCCRNACR